jgi:hypothetical protein
MKNKALLIFRIFAVAVSLFGMTYRLIINPLNGNGWKYAIYQLGFFSIQTNIFITIIFILLLISQLRGKPEKAPTPVIRGGVLLYGTIVTILFFVFFNNSFEAQGFNRVVLYINHVALTVLLFIDNIVSVKPQSYNWKLLGSWMIYPFIYLIYMLIESSVFHYYRYHFIGLERMTPAFHIIALILLIVIFYLCASLIIFINKIYRKNQNSEDELIMELKDEHKHHKK